MSILVEITFPIRIIIQQLPSLVWVLYTHEAHGTVYLRRWPSKIECSQPVSCNQGRHSNEFGKIEYHVNIVNMDE